MSATRRRKPSEPADWQAGQEKAREGRAAVAAQLTDLLRERDMTGSADDFGRRFLEVIEARRSGDRTVLRAAVMEAVVAGAAWVVEIDLRSPQR